MNIEDVNMKSYPFKDHQNLLNIPDQKVYPFHSDPKSTFGVWSCTEGEFYLHFDWIEHVYLLEGEVEVDREDGSTIRLIPGDMATFLKNEKTTWRILQACKKIFTAVV